MFGIHQHRRLTGYFRGGLLAVLLVYGLCSLPARPAAAAGITVSAEPRGSGLQFHATSSVAVDWEIQFSTVDVQTAPFPPHFPAGSSVVRLTSKGAVQTAFDPALYQLPPSTVYNYIARGASSYTTGTVRTFGNKVTVVFTAIDVIDDSDDTGAGELTFHFDAGAGFNAQVGEVAVHSTKPVPMPTGRSAINRSSFNEFGTLQLRVEGVDDDKDPPFEACRTGQPPDGTSGSDSCFDWATARFATNVAQFAGFSQNVTSKVVTFQTTSSFRLKFKVTATITVEYGDKFVG